MKKKTTFRMMIITSAFALLTLPTMMNVGSALAAPAPAGENCLGEFLGCMANTGGDPQCIEDYTACVFSRK